MSSSPVTNFDFLDALGQRIHFSLSEVVAQMRRAEWIYQIAPEPCIMQCRAASEVLARAFQLHLLTPTAHVPPSPHREAFRADLFNTLADESQRQNRRAASRAWKELRYQYRNWSDVVHAKVSATPNTALEALRSLHRLAADLHKDYCAAPTPQFCMPAAIPDFTAISQLRGELKKSQSEKRDFEAECRNLQRKEAELTKRHSEDSSTVQALRAKIEAGGAPSFLRERANALEQQIRTHETQRQTLALQLKQADDCRREAEQKVHQMTTRIEHLELDQAKQKSVILQLEDSLDNTNSALADARDDVDRIIRETAGAISQRHQAAMELDGVRLELKELKRKQTSAGHSKQLTELLQRSEKRVGDLASQVARLADETADKEAQLAVARKQSKVLETTLDELQQGLVRLRQESAETRTALNRLDAYRTSYPDMDEDVPAFLYELLFAQPVPLPPFQQLSNVIALPADPYFERHHASHANEACTVRIATRRNDRAIDDLLDAWRIERSNLSYVGNLRHRRGIARLIVVADPERPGFSVFSRPDAPLLSEFGRDVRRLRLRHAVRFAYSLVQEIQACWEAGMITSWPDITSVAVQGEHAVLLDPVASHFGDLGPPLYLDRPPSDTKYLSETELAAALAFATANAFVRVVGLLPRGRQLSAALRPKSVEDHLLEVRRADPQAADIVATARLAALMAAATHSDAARRPKLSDVKDALERVGRATGT